jgi:uncharacterized protein YdhG (YjbR/CyaY superfamily)
MAKTNFGSVNEYIAAQPAEMRRVLKRVRSIIRRAVPDADEGISYQIPAYKLNGRVVVYFAGWKEHYSVYPFVGRVADLLKADVAGYERSKGTIRFPLSEPIPEKLIARIVTVRAADAAAGAAARNANSTRRKNR